LKFIVAMREPPAGTAALRFPDQET